MASVTETPELERLFATGRERALMPAAGRERRVEAGAAGAFLLVAAAMAVLLPSPRSLDPSTLAVLLIAYVIACRAKFDIADGYTVPTELVLVPMLFLLPTPAVPLIVSVSWALGRLIDYATGRTSIRRAFHVFADCWHSVGPALVLVAVGAQVLSWHDWPIYLLALLASSPPTRLGHRPRLACVIVGVPPAPAAAHDRARVYLVDVAPDADRVPRRVRLGQTRRRRSCSSSRWRACCASSPASAARASTRRSS